MADLFTDPSLRPQSHYYAERRAAAQAGGGGFGKLVVAGLFLLVVAGGVTYSLLKRSVVIDTVVPTILAEVGAIKERPSDPGGLEVLHQDTTVYDRLDKAGGRGKVEQLLPPAEKPSEKLLAETRVRPQERVELKSGGAVETMAVKTPAENTLVGQLAASQPVEDKMIEEKLLVAPVEHKEVEQKNTAPKVVDTAIEPKLIASVPVPKSVPVEASKPVSVAPTHFKTPEEMAALKAGKTLPLATKTPAPMKTIEPIKAVVAPVKTPVKVVEIEPKLVTPTEQSTQTSAPLDVAGILAKSGVTKTETPKVVAPVAAPPVSASNGRDVGLSRVQLAASTNQEAAEKKMMDMVGSHADLLRATRLTTVRADLGSKGIYYRIQTQAMPTADAVKLCANLKVVQQGCLLVKVNN
jgi:hypothetical protein